MVSCDNSPNGRIESKNFLRIDQRLLTIKFFSLLVLLICVLLAVKPIKNSLQLLHYILTAHHALGTFLGIWGTFMNKTD